ncbi:MAG: NAD(P)-dependent oxidoreductase [Agarilytica sp.]
MKIAITGANGFIGQHVVDAALASEHHVLAIIRSSAPEVWKSNSALDILRCDLCEANTAQLLSEALQGYDVIIHLAAVMQGDNQYSDTITATKNVLSATKTAQVTRFIDLSSISVLNYQSKAPMSVIDEETAMQTIDSTLGEYAKMKRDQENLCMQWHDASHELIILRPGLVYDAAHLSNAHAGFKVLASLHTGEVPVVHVAGVAKACVLAAENKEVRNGVIHLTNDHLPKQATYLEKLKQKGSVGTIIPLPWQVYAVLMTILRFHLKLIEKVPDGVRKNSVNARHTPFLFSNEKAKKLLHWQPASSLDD